MNRKVLGQAGKDWRQIMMIPPAAGDKVLRIQASVKLSRKEVNTMQPGEEPSILNHFRHKNKAVRSMGGLLRRKQRVKINGGLFSPPSGVNPDPSRRDHDDHCCHVHQRIHLYHDAAYAVS